MPDLAVIFDADGVLVDSYQAHLESWRKAASEAGYSLSDAQFAATFGRTSREIMRLCWSGAELTPQRIEAIDARKEALYRTIIADRFPVMDGAVALIDDLKRAGFVLAVGTSGPPENLSLLLKELDGEQWCSASVSGVDVQHGKPDPEVFLLCARRLEVPPRRCAVIEDAAPGIAAARAAGMSSVALVSHGHTHDELAAADHVVDRLAELSAARIAAWIGVRGG